MGEAGAMTEGWTVWASCCLFGGQRGWVEMYNPQVL
jgi:hypothetical protein